MNAAGARTVVSFALVAALSGCSASYLKQPVETPIQPSDLPVYKEAVAQGVQIVLLKDLRNYFRF